jgi:hypothetical protein
MVITTGNRTSASSGAQPLLQIASSGKSRAITAAHSSPVSVSATMSNAGSFSTIRRKNSRRATS